MKRWIAVGLLLIISCGTVTYLLDKRENLGLTTHLLLVNELVSHSSRPVLCYLDLKSLRFQANDNPFRHLKLTVVGADDFEVDSEVFDSIPLGTPLVLSVEVWQSFFDRIRGQNVSKSVASGVYDRALERICERLLKGRTQAYLRFNPEMEVPGSTHPWQGFPKDYIESFHHVSTFVKKFAPQVKILWGPAGYPGTMEHYPGDEYVDAVSVTLKPEAENSLDAYPNDYTLSYDFKRRLHRLRFLQKPVFILGSQNTTKEWNDDQIERYLKEIGKDWDLVSSYNQPLDQGYLNTDYRKGALNLGLYDPIGRLVNQPEINTEHYFIDFLATQDDTLWNRLKASINRGHDLIVTFEPKFPEGEVQDTMVLKNITDGKYDRNLRNFYRLLRKLKGKIYLRFAQEMEIPIHRYPWQSKDPADYIKAYRYFMNFEKELPSSVERVWGPAGDRGSIEWYPGDDVVDYVSIAIYGLPDKNITDPNQQESFEKIFARKSWRLRFINKPIFITEFGVKGPEDYQTVWLENAAKTINANPNIVGINYFNLSDVPKAWGDIQPPDWSLSEQTFRTFIYALSPSLCNDGGQQNSF
ncbi:MAG: hypothetical protein WA913_13760 [Pricia sp.]